MRHYRISFAFGAAIGLTCFLTVHSRAEVGPQGNMILILVDDMGARDWSGAGNRLIETPNIDALAKDGVVFEQSYSAAAVCSPSRAALLTGRYPCRSGITDWIRPRAERPYGTQAGVFPVNYIGGPHQEVLCPPNPYNLPISERTLADRLHGGRFVSAFIGKWHLGDEDWSPLAQGFDFNFGGCDLTRPPSYFDPYSEPGTEHSTLGDGIPGLRPRKVGQYLTDREADEACDFIRQWKDRYFFIQLAHYGGAADREAPESLIKKYKRKGASRRRAIHAAKMESVDHSLGKIRDTLQEVGLADKTLIWLTSDNGGPFVDRSGSAGQPPLRGSKGSPYEGGIRVPTIVHFPAKIAAGVSQDPISSIDVYRTLDRFASGWNAPNPGLTLDGADLMPHLFEKLQVSVPDRSLYWHFPHYRNGVFPYSIIRRGDMKLIHFYASEEGGEKQELYDLSLDPSESNDLASERPVLVEDLKSELMRALRLMQAQMPKPNPKFAEFQSKSKSKSK
ncbi:MAG: sulfatase [Aureliella sp.]